MTLTIRSESGNARSMRRLVLVRAERLRSCVQMRMHAH